MWRPPSKIRDRSWLELAARWLVGLTFLYAGLGKFGDLSLFAEQIAAYGLLPSLGNKALAVVLPPLEVLCGVSLLLGWWVEGASALAALCLLMFMVALASAMARGLRIDCGCFSLAKSHAVSFWRLAEDFVLFGAAVYVWMANSLRRPAAR
ncbi:MAG: DoxX family membrane protein [candidate division KSB1 bacterium]|nr:DoxX family membrane protein [candidate division KSB1 bacterium]